MIVNKVLSFFLIVSFTIFIYQVIKIVIDLRKKNFVGTMAKSLNERYENRKILKKAQELYEGSVEDEKLMYMLDSLFERSGIKKIFPFLTSELLISITISVAIIVSMIINIKFKFWLYTTAAFVAVVFIVIFFLSFMSNLTYNKIDNQIMVYVGTLKNLSETNTDIITIFEKSIPYARGPLKEYVEQFVFECKRGIPLERAFNNFKNKVESKRLKELITNLNISSNHNANYKKLLDKVKIIFKRHDYFKRKRQYIARVGRFGIVSLIAIGGYIFSQMQQLNSDVGVIDKLKESFVGNGLLIYMGIILIIALYIFLTLDKVND